jgi:hypothetical protein
MGMGLIFMNRQDSFYYKDGTGAWVSHGQNIFAGIIIILMGIVGIYTLYRNKSE